MPQTGLSFFDAPLLEVVDEQYSMINTYYASVHVKNAGGRLRFGGRSAGQEDKLEQHNRAAEKRGPRSGYSGEPRWPISLRNTAWRKLMELGIRMLDVDDLVSARRWSWDWCVVARLVLCGND